jgi:hypothetical protein
VGHYPFETCFVNGDHPYSVTLLTSGLGYFRAKLSPICIPQLFSNLVIIRLLACEDGTECSKMSAYKIQTPENYPEENMQHTEHGESLKLRILLDCVAVEMTALQSFKVWGTTCLVTQQHVPEDVNVHHHCCALCVPQTLQHQHFMRPCTRPSHCGICICSGCFYIITHHYARTLVCHPE